MKRIFWSIGLAAVTAGILFIGFGQAEAVPPGPGFGGMHGLMRNVDLTDSQIDKMLDLKKDMQASHIKLNNERRDLLDEAGKLSDDTEANRNRLGDIAKRLDAIDLQLEKDRVQHHEKMMNMLTDEQWEQIGIDRAQAREAFGDRPMRGRHMGRGFGPGHGRGQGGPGWGQAMAPGRGPCGQGYGPGWRSGR